MFLSFGNMEKEILLVLICVCYSHQRPQLEVDISTTTEVIANDNTSEEIKTSEKIVQATEAAAVLVQTSINVSTLSPSQVFEDFKPSNYYRPDGDPIYERPSPQVTHEVFYKPQYFRRPNSLVYQMQKNPDDSHVVFPEIRQKHYTERQFNSSNVPESRSRQKFNEVLPQYKPVKHDSGDIEPNFNSYTNYFESNLGKYHVNEMFHERDLGKYHGNQLSNYPEIMHEPPTKFMYTPPSKSNYNIAKPEEMDPWKGVLSFVAKLLPLGILLAAFPATVIKVDSKQYPYQFQKNATHYPNQSNYPNYPNVMVGKFKSLRKKHTGRKVNEEEGESSGYLDDCLKKKLCESIKTNYKPNEIESFLQNNKLNSTHNNGPVIVEIAKAAASTSSESCRVFVCSN